MLSGQVALELDPDGELLTLSGPGEWFGELALLTSRPRSADARIAVDATLLRIDREGWSTLSQAVPRLFARICERLSRQLQARDDRESLARRRVVACGDPGEPRPAWLPDLVASLRRQFPKRDIRALGPDGTPLDAGDRGLLDRTADRRALAAALALMTDRSALILVPFGAADDLADRSLQRVRAREWRLAPGCRSQAPDRITGGSVEAALDRAARHLAGGTVGIALGAGGAFGLGHLGVLDVLESAGIPIDCVAGTSIGAVIGGILAFGISIAEVIEYAAYLVPRFRSIVLRDVDLRGHTLLTGERVMEVLADLEGLGEARFESLNVPFAAVAMDVRTGEQVVLDSGRLLDRDPAELRDAERLPALRARRSPADRRGDGQPRARRRRPRARRRRRDRVPADSGALNTGQ